MLFSPATLCLGRFSASIDLQYTQGLLSCMYIMYRLLHTILSLCITNPSQQSTLINQNYCFAYFRKKLVDFTILWLFTVAIKCLTEV